MKTILRYLLSLFAFYLAVFLLAKLAFVAYNHDAETFGTVEVLRVLWHGLPMDASTTGYLLALPWLACLLSCWLHYPLRRLLIPYYIIIGVLLALILLGDTLLYEYWKFKLDASIFSYMAAAGGAADSVSLAYIAGGIVAYLLLAAFLFLVPIRFTPKVWGKGRMSLRPTTKVACRHSLALLILGGFIFVMIRGGVQEGTMNVGTAYHSEKLFLNHAAVNPAFSLFYSATKYKRFNQQFRYFTDEECSEIFDPLYPDKAQSRHEAVVQDGDAMTHPDADTLLTTRRPQILYIQLESFGAQFIEELGGKPDVCPNLSRFIREGVFFDNMYANSFRTDRGTVSAISGHTAYPTASLMRLPAKLDGLPSIPRSLIREGYSTDYAYGGDITIMGKQGYLVSAGFQKLVSSKDFSIAQANETKWGVNDSTIMADALRRILARPQDKLWFTGVQTLNSHEPFEVPYHRLPDKVQNAFAYTDHCLGQFIDSLRQSPVWDNLLIILMPDHGIMYELSYEDPAFFHIPMVWLGGAVREPRRIHTLMNQSDLAATLLGQLGIAHDEFPWSRNVLSPAYDYPFAFCSFPSGIVFADSTGVSVYDITANRVITEQAAPGTESSEQSASGSERIRRAKAILQRSYDQLDKMGHRITLDNPR